MKRWLWPLSIFAAAMLGGSICAEVAVRALLETQSPRDSALLTYLASTLAKGDIETRLSTIEAAQRGDVAAVVRLNCVFLKAGVVRLSIIADGAPDRRHYEDFIDRARARATELEKQGKCGAVQPMDRSGD